MFEMILQQDLGVLPVQHDVNDAVVMLDVGQTSDGPPPPGKLSASIPGTTSLEIGQSNDGPPPPPRDKLVANLPDTTSLDAGQSSDGPPPPRPK
ncbi:MAG: hypothetical protein RL748_2880 [Pseudomonadota bacterium]